MIFHWMIPLVKIRSKKYRYLGIYWLQEIASNGKILSTSRQCLLGIFYWCAEYFDVLRVLSVMFVYMLADSHLLYGGSGAVKWTYCHNFLCVNYFKKLHFHIFILLFWVYYPSWWMFLFSTKQRKKLWN